MSRLEVYLENSKLVRISLLTIVFTLGYLIFGFEIAAIAILVGILDEAIMINIKLNKRDHSE